MPTDDNPSAPAGATPVTARALSTLTANGALWYFNAWAGSGGAGIRVGGLEARLMSAAARPLTEVDGAKFLLALVAPGFEMVFEPEDVGPTDGGRAAVRFSGNWWDAVAIAYLGPVRVRLVPSIQGYKMMVVLDGDGDARAVLMPMRVNDAEVERVWSRVDDDEGWPM